MAKARPYHHSLNVGVVDKTALARVDLERMRLAAEEQTNLLGTTVGGAFLRPGLEYLSTTFNSQPGRIRAFIRGADSAALLEFYDGLLCVKVDDQYVARSAVSSVITNGDFSDASGWTLVADDGATEIISGGILGLIATGKGSTAIAKQQVATASAGQRHALRIVVARGPVVFRCGSTDGGDEYITETELAEGTHSLAFTPSGSYWVQFQTNRDRYSVVDSINVESAGVMVLPTPWFDQAALRFAQSIDVMFVASDTQQMRIERRSDDSWSVVKYLADDGPFTVSRTAPVRLKPNVTHGNGTLTADKPFFRPEHVGALFRLFHEGQAVFQALSGGGQFTDPIEVTGVNATGYNDREFSYTATGTYTGTLKIFRSFDGADFGYKEFKTYSADDKATDDDDNAVVYYRFGFAEGDYTNGTAFVGLTYAGGGGYGICRVIGYDSPTQVQIEVLRPFKNIIFTEDWREGEWSNWRGWPSAVAMTEGRLWWGGSDKFWGSVSDAYNSFDEDYEGDAGPILKSIAVDGVNSVKSLLPLQRLVALTDGSEATARSSSFDEPLTPSNTTVKTISTYGSAPVDSVKIDARGLFVGKDRASLYEIVFSVEAGDFQTTELSKLTQSLFRAGVKEAAVQRKPDTRIWVVMDDGSLVCIVYEPQQEVVAFIPFETEGRFESVAVLPADAQDRVYFIVNRPLNGTDVRYIEKMAKDEDATPGMLALIMDCFKTGTQTASTTITGATHLIGRDVKVWADGKPVTEQVTIDGRTYTKPRLFRVNASGQITGLPFAVENYVYGLPYQARYKSARLAYGASGGTALMQKQIVNDFGVILANYVRSGVMYGRDFDHLYPLPKRRDGLVAADVNDGVIVDEGMHPFDGSYSTDSRICMTFDWPATVLGLVFTVDTSG